MVGDALSLKSRPVSASNGHWRGPFFAERRKGPLAAGHLPGNPPRTSQNRGPGGHMWGKSPQPSSIEGWAIFSDGRKRNMCHFLDGNRLCANLPLPFGVGLAANELYVHFEAGMGRALIASNRNCAPLSGGTGRNGGCDGRREGSAREGGPGRGARSAHMFDSQPEWGPFRPSDWHMVRFSPALIELSNKV